MGLIDLFQKNKDPAHLRSGRWGEIVAAKYLKKHKYKILGKRVRVGRHDELDIVAKQNDTIIFVEVKTRKNEDYGSPISAVNKAKKKHLSRAAIQYLKSIKTTPDYIRFDVVEVVGEPDNKEPTIRHIENAFPLDSSYKLWW